jgi:hypothetical protein
MVKVRNSLGRFTQIEQGDGGKNTNSNFDFLYSEITLKMPKITVINIIKLFLFLIFISPWIFVGYNRGGVSYLTDNVAQFYKEKFSGGNNQVCMGMAAFSAPNVTHPKNNTNF